MDTEDVVDKRFYVASEGDTYAEKVVALSLFGTPDQPQNYSSYLICNGVIYIHFNGHCEPTSLPIHCFNIRNAYRPVEWRQQLRLDLRVFKLLISSRAGKVSALGANDADPV